MKLPLDRALATENEPGIGTEIVEPAAKSNAARRLEGSGQPELGVRRFAA